MLVGFGAYGTEPSIIPDLTGASLLEIYRQKGERCHTANQSQIEQGYPKSVCLKSRETLDKEKYMNMGIGAAVGAVVGAAAVYLMTR